MSNFHGFMILALLAIIIADRKEGWQKAIWVFNAVIWFLCALLEMVR